MAGTKASDVLAAIYESTAHDQSERKQSIPDNPFPLLKRTGADIRKHIKSMYGNKALLIRAFNSMRRFHTIFQDRKNPNNLLKDQTLNATWVAAYADLEAALTKMDNAMAAADSAASSLADFTKEYTSNYEYVNESRYIPESVADYVDLHDSSDGAMGGRAAEILGLTEKSDMGDEEEEEEEEEEYGDEEEEEYGDEEEEEYGDEEEEEEEEYGDEGEMPEGEG